MSYESISQFPMANEATYYKAVAASQSTVPIATGASTGKALDYIDHIVIVPASTAAGAVTLFDGTTAALTMPAWQTGATAPVTSYSVPVRARAQSRWNITTGANVSVLVVGSF